MFYCYLLCLAAKVLLSWWNTTRTTMHFIDSLCLRVKLYPEHTFEMEQETAFVKGL